MTRKEIASKYLSNKFNCSQSVFVAFAQDHGLSVDDSLKIACAFGGGMGRQQKTCGAVTGALMAIGMKYGKALNDAEEKKKDTYDKTAEFFSEFKKIHGSTNCKKLLNNLDMKKSDDMEKIRNMNLIDTLCPKYVETAVIIAEKLIK